MPDVAREWCAANSIEPRSRLRGLPSRQDEVRKRISALCNEPFVGIEEGTDVLSRLQGPEKQDVTISGRLRSGCPLRRARRADRDLVFGDLQVTDHFAGCEPRWDEDVIRAVRMGSHERGIVASDLGPRPFGM